MRVAIPTQDCLGFYTSGRSREIQRVREGARTKMYGGQVEKTSTRPFQMREECMEAEVVCLLAG
jgi:hypothetical protein